MDRLLLLSTDHEGDRHITGDDRKSGEVSHSAHPAKDGSLFLLGLLLDMLKKQQDKQNAPSNDMLHFFLLRLAQ